MGQGGQWGLVWHQYCGFPVPGVGKSSGNGGLETRTVQQQMCLGAKDLQRPPVGTPHRSKPKPLGAWCGQSFSEIGGEDLRGSGECGRPGGSQEGCSEAARGVGVDLMSLRPGRQAQEEQQLQGDQDAQRRREGGSAAAV